MKYDPREPLIFIHVPKTGGASVRRIFQQWFPGLHLHYFDEKSDRKPRRRELRAGDVVYGHFNRLRGFGIQDYYPGVRQFITLLRDPFEMAVSNYFYVRAVGATWKNPPRAVPIDDIVTQPLNMLNHFPVEVTSRNFREVLDSFLYIGITERMDESLRAVAAMIGREYIPAERHNAAERSEAYAHLREAFERNHPLERAAYEYARQRD